MKKHIIIVLALSVMMLIGCGTMPKQTKLPPGEQKIQYVIDVPGKLQDDIYRRSNEWMVRTFNSAEDVIQYQDKEEGIITGKCFMFYNVGEYQRRIKTVITLEMKDEKVRMTFEDMCLLAYNPSNLSLKQEYRPLKTEEEMQWFRDSTDALSGNYKRYLFADTEDW